MEKKVLRRVFLSAVFLMSVLAVSCTIGMGESVDLEAPEITITSPSNFAYVPKTFSISGTYYDNKEVKKVIVSYNYLEGAQTKSAEVEATLKDGTWIASFSFASDCEANFKITAYDEMQNTSEKSVRNLTLIVDSTDPNVKEFIVKKNDIYEIEMNSIAFFESKDITDTSAKDFFQNEEFKVCATLSDNFKVAKSTLSLFDVNGAVIMQNIPTDEVKAGVETRNEHSPTFTITERDLIAVNPKFNDKQYIRPVITTTDAAGNVSVYESGYICWWPESDKPRVSFPLEDAEGKLNVGKDTKLPFTFFDDDGVSNVYYGLIPKIDWDSDSGTTIEQKFKNFNATAGKFSSKAITGGDRDSQIPDYTSGSTSGTYMYVVAVEDKKAEGYDSTWNYYAKLTLVESMDIPILVMSTTENSAPTLENKKFKIEGYTLDDKHITKIAIAWLPNGDDQVSTALTNLKTITTFTQGTQISGSNGIKIWIPTITHVTDNDATTGKDKDTFKQEFSIATDFMVGTTQKGNDRKVFVLLVRDEDNNIISKTFRLGSYSVNPTIELEYEESAGKWAKFSSVDKKEGETIKFRTKATSPINLSISSCTVTGKFGNTPLTFDSKNADGYYCFEYTANAAGRLEFTITATDELGNKDTQTSIVSFGEVPKLLSITTTNRSGTTLKAGDKLTINANFSETVKEVTGSPYILLKNINGVTGDQKATYVKGAGTDVLEFTYTVPAGAYTKSGSFVDTNASPISDGSGIDATWNKSVNTLFASRIGIDTISPTITISPSENGVLTKSGSTATITLTFSEPVYKESGRIIIERTANWSIPPVIKENVFKKIYEKVDNASKIALIGSADGKPALESGSLTPVGPYKKYTQGLKVEGEKYVPDTDTKYVLAYNYDLQVVGSDSVVGRLRTALEEANYHKHEYDLTSLSGTNGSTTFTLTINDSDWIDGFKNGVEYKITIPANAFRDAVGNTTAETTSTFWTDGVAKPYIRVDRKTSNGGANRPSGKVSVRIDSETPGATIKYYVDDSKKVSIEEDINATKTHKVTKCADEGEQHDEYLINVVNHKTIDDISTTDASNFVCNTTYSNSFEVGDGELTTGQKIYIKAVATKAKNGSQPELSESKPDYEGAFKTLNYYERPRYGTGWSMGDDIKFYGCDVPEGVPSVSGFPFGQNGNSRNYRIAYKFKIDDEGKADNNGNYYAYVLVSWEIICPYTNQTYTSNYQEPADAYCTYGEALYTYRRNYSGNSDKSDVPTN